MIVTMIMKSGKKIIKTFLKLLLTLYSRCIIIMIVRDKQKQKQIKNKNKNKLKKEFIKMAKNYTVAEVADAIVQNRIEEMLDFGKRFPLTTNLISIGLAVSQKSVSTLLYAFPPYVTMGKIEKSLKAQIENGTYGKFIIADEDAADEDDDDEGDEEEVEDNKPAKPAKAAKPAKPAKATKQDDDDDDIKLKTGKEVWQMCKDAGYTTTELKGKKKADLIEMFNKKASSEKPVKSEKKSEKPASKYDGKSAKELYKMCKDAELDVEQKKSAEYYIEVLENAEEEAEETVDYSKMSARELYALCKEKGLKPEQKKPNKYYIDLLSSDDEGDGADNADGWEEDEAEDNKPAKSTKPAKATKQDQDADDEWEI